MTHVFLQHLLAFAAANCEATSGSTSRIVNAAQQVRLTAQPSCHSKGHQQPLSHMLFFFFLSLPLSEQTAIDLSKIRVNKHHLTDADQASAFLPANTCNRVWNHVVRRTCFLGR